MVNIFLFGTVISSGTTIHPMAYLEEVRDAEQSLGIET